MYYSTVVKVVREGNRGPIPGAQVKLFDRDRFSRDDLLGTGVTNADGEARFDYEARKFNDLEDRLAGGYPDLYAIAYAADGSEVARSQPMVENTFRKTIQLSVPDDVADRQSWGAPGAPVPPAEPAANS